MAILQLDYPDGLEFAINLTSEELVYQIKVMAALKMFELGKISSGKAAQWIGVSRLDFFEICKKYKVSLFNYQPDEIEHEILNDLKTLETFL